MTITNTPNCQSERAEEIANDFNNYALLDEHTNLVRRLQSISPDFVYLNTKEASIFLRCTTKCLERRRVAGLPPKFKKQGSKVLYQLSELIDSLEERSNTCARSDKK